MNPPDKVPDAVIESIAKSHVKYERQGECPFHDHKWDGHHIPETIALPCGKEAPNPCTCVVKMVRFEFILKQLRWSGDHYSFNFAGMYVGVELDGYMHT